MEKKFILIENTHTNKNNKLNKNNDIKKDAKPKWRKLEKKKQNKTEGTKENHWKAYHVPEWFFIKTTILPKAMHFQTYPS